jgi:hypothetical protein
MKSDTKTKIEILQRSKQILAIEAVAINTSILLGVILVNRFIENETTQDLLILFGCLFGIGYALYACIGNLLRYFKVKELEEDL